jgi:hypothetical protein
MAIRINLLAESQAAEEMRRKDPVKRSIWIGAFLVFVVLLVSMTLQFKIMAARSELSRLSGDWKEIEKQVLEINDRRNQITELEQKLSALDQFTTNRMLWANTFNALQHTIVDGVQLVGVRTEQTFTLNEPAQPTDKQTVTERITVKLLGKDFRAGEQVPKFKDALQMYPYFESHLDKTNKIQLTSLSAPNFEGGRPSRIFGLQLSFQEKERFLYE